jgi:hypothetical protein
LLEPALAAGGFLSSLGLRSLADGRWAGRLCAGGRSLVAGGCSLGRRPADDELEPVLGGRSAGRRETVEELDPLSPGRSAGRRETVEELDPLSPGRSAGR